MKKLIFAIAIMAGTTGHSQSKLNFTGKIFWAFNVPNTEETSKWYEDIFQMKLLKEIKFPEGHIRIIGNDQLTIEILSLKGSRTLGDCSLTSEDSHKLRGLLKAGFYVPNIQEAEKYLKSKGVKIKHETFEDDDTHSRSFIFTDLNENLIQVLQEK